METLLIGVVYPKYIYFLYNLLSLPCWLNEPHVLLCSGVRWQLTPLPSSCTFTFSQYHALSFITHSLAIKKGITLYPLPQILLKYLDYFAKGTKFTSKGLTLPKRISAFSGGEEHTQGLLSEPEHDDVSTLWGGPPQTQHCVGLVKGEEWKVKWKSSHLYVYVNVNLCVYLSCTLSCEEKWNQSCVVCRDTWCSPGIP